jgi:hypothetical protein
MSFTTPSRPLPLFATSLIYAFSPHLFVVVVCSSLGPAIPYDGECMSAFQLLLRRFLLQKENVHDVNPDILLHRLGRYGTSTALPATSAQLPLGIVAARNIHWQYY